MRLNYYRRYVGDYMRDTAHLSILEHGAYSLMLDYCYATEKPLPGDLDALYRLCRAMSRPEQEAVRKVAGEFFKLRDDGYHNPRADREIGVAQSTIGKQRESGAQAAAKRWSKDRSTDESMNGSMDGSTHKSIGGSEIQPPTTNHQPPASTPHPPEKTPRKRDAPPLPNSDELLADVSPQVRGDWLAIRKAKRLPLTQTAMDGIRSEVGKAGLTLQAALEICCRRGWGSFESAWDWRETSSKNGMTPYQQMQVEKHQEAKRFTEAIHGKRNDGPREPIDITPERVD